MNNEKRPVPIRLGPMEFLLDGAEVRYVRIAGREVVRRIYCAVRDRRWGSVPYSVISLGMEGDSDRFVARCRCEYRAEGIAFDCLNTVEGHLRRGGAGIDAEIDFLMEGRANSTFWTNRTGLCVLHPIQGCAGEPCEVEHSDGTKEASAFPTQISPGPVFTGIRAIRQRVAGKSAMELRFEGELFECEDQRNWSDSSFKTYCRPLSRPFPYQLREGEEVRQAVRIRVPGIGAEPADRVGRIRVGEVAGALPSIGLGAPDVRLTLDVAGLRQIQMLNLSHARVDLRHGREDLASAQAQQLKRLELPLEIAVHLARAGSRDVEGSQSRQAAVLRSLCNSTEVHRVIVYREGKAFAPAGDVDLVSRWIADGGRVPLVGGGTIGSLAEINRNRQESAAMGLIGYAISPQVHATDDLSLIENLEAQGDTVRTARSFAPHAHLAVGPVVLHRVPDPFAAGMNGEAGEPVGDEPRYRLPLSAAWTLGSLKHLSEAGANSITYFSMLGFGGVLDGGRRLPAHDVFGHVGEMKGGLVRRCISSEPLSFDALAITKGRRLRVIVACLCDQPRQVCLDNLPGGNHAVHLAPFEVRAIDFELAEGT